MLKKGTNEIKSTAHSKYSCQYYIVFAPKYRRKEIYRAIVTLLESSIDKNLSVSEIAEICNMSEINLKKTFSKYSGLGVIKYFNQMKVTAGIEMIKNEKSVA